MKISSSFLIAYILYKLLQVIWYACRLPLQQSGFPCHIFYRLLLVVAIICTICSTFIIFTHIAYRYEGFKIRNVLCWRSEPIPTLILLPNVYVSVHVHRSRCDWLLLRKYTILIKWHLIYNPFTSDIWFIFAVQEFTYQFDLILEFRFICVWLCVREQFFLLI